jgi:sorbitol-specific phosphotransferase system component IIC
MSLTLFRCEKSLRTFRWLYLGLAMGLFLVVIHGSIPDGENPFPEGPKPNAWTPITFIFWTWITIFLVYGGLLGRGERLCLTLPLSSRRIWLFHVAALMLSVVLIFAIALGFLAAVNSIRGIPPLKPGLVTIALNIAAMTALLTAAIQLPDRDSFEVRLNAGNVIFLLIVWIIAWLAIVFFSGMPRVAALAPLAAGIALLAVVYRVLPSIFQLQTDTPVPPEAEIDDFRQPSPLEKINGSVRPGLSLLHATIFKLFYRHWVTVLFLPWLLLIGVLLSGYLSIGLNSITLLAAVIAYMSGLLQYALSRMYMIEPLPVSRRLLHAYLVLPVLAVTVLSYAAGIAVGKGSAPKENLLFYGEKRYDRTLDVRVPLEFWEIGWDGEPAPVSNDCCDEPYAAWSTPLFKGSGIVIYCPYHTPPGSPPSFVAEQLSRAAERVFGTRLDPKDIEERYFVTGPDGVSRMRGETINIGKDFPHLRAQNWRDILPVVALLVGIPWFLIAALTFQLFSAGRNGRALQVVLAAAVTIWILFIIFVSSSGFTSEWKVGSLAWILVRKLAEGMPGGTGTSWLVAALLLLGGYLLSWTQFRRVEAPVKRSGADYRP